MRQHIADIMKKVEFPEEARDFFLRLYDRLSDDEIRRIRNQESVYFMDNITDRTDSEVNSEVEGALKIFSADSGYDCRCIYVLFALFCTRRLRADYYSRGFDDELYYDIVRDLRYKIIECKKYDGVWGSMSFPWLHWHFLMKRFALGRFQYEEAQFKDESYNFGDIHLRKGDRVINVHIPSSGHMTEEARMDSYAKAYKFFKREGDKYIVLVCNSWLLYPGNVNVYPEDSNLMDFFKDFDIISSDVHPVLPFPNAWRVFYKDYYGDSSNLPRNTRLEKNIAEWLADGNKIGNGYGIIIFDGEKIVNKHS